MDFGIRGKVAFVSGGSKGMAAAAARMLAAEGCKVAIVARSQGPIDDAVAYIRDHGGTAMGVSTDLLTRQGVATAVAAVTAEFGAPDIAISNIVGSVAGNFDDVTDDDFRRVFDVFTMSVIHLAREVIPNMKKNGWGRFVGISATSVKEPEGMIRHVLSNTARPAAIGFLKTLSDEVARHGITINSVAPGWVGTDTLLSYLKKNLNLDPEQVTDWLKDDVPAGRLGTPEEIGSLITYLCSVQASFITGDLIIVDGGKHRSAF